MAVNIRRKNDKEGKASRPTLVYTSGDHAQSAESVMRHYEKLDHHEDHEDRLIDLLQDLHHWADRHYADFDAACQEAKRRYQGTINEEAEMRAEFEKDRELIPVE